MKSYKYFVFLLLPIIGQFILSCDATEQNVIVEKPSITYEVSGGFFPGIKTKLIIASSGLAKLESTYPVIEYQLNEDEHSHLLSYFNNFDEFPDSFPNSCVDGIIFNIEFNRSDYSKKITIDQCIIVQKDSNSVIAKINSIIVTLDSLAQSIYVSSNSWKGLTTDFSIDSDIYGQGESIKMYYRITNSTAKERVLYFEHKNQFLFSLDRENFPSFHYSYPNVHADSSLPTEIKLQPGETKVIVYNWDQKVADSILEIGYYKLRMNLSAGIFPTEEIWFEVIDRNIPITGVIIPDFNSEASESPIYKFNLAIRNWSSKSIEIYFPANQRIRIELYDLGLSPPMTLVFLQPTEKDSTSSVDTLLQGETKVYSYEASKSDFSSWYMWTYAKIQLLCKDFEFSRDAQLRIF